MKYPVALFNLKEVVPNVDEPYSPPEKQLPIHLWEYPFIVRSVLPYVDLDSKVLVNDAGLYGLPMLLDCCFAHDRFDAEMYLIHSRLLHGLYCEQHTCYRRHLNPSALRVLYQNEYDAIILPNRINDMADNGIASLFRLVYNLLADDGIVVCTERITSNRGFKHLNNIFNLIGKYTDFKFVTPRACHVVDVDSIIDDTEELDGFFWPIMQERMRVFHNKDYTTCGWMLRKKSK